jgi:hypothetical protein
MIRRKRLTRAELIERKHRLEGEINTLQSDLRRQERCGQDTALTESRLARARRLHYQTRLEIDRAPVDR